MCKDKRWLIYDVPYGHPKFGKLEACSACSEEKERASLQVACGLAEEWQEWMFENTARHEGNGAAYDAALRLARNPERFLTLTGSYGRGKSRILACIVNAANRNGMRAIYAVTPSLLADLRKGFNRDAKVGYDELMDRVLTARVLCLDEFSQFNATNWAEDQICQIVDERYQRGRELLTCFALNAAIEELPEYLQSRMLDRQCCVIEVSGPDIRQLRP